MQHYRCITAYFPRTVTFFPHDVAFPWVLLKYHLIQAAEDIVNILMKPPSSTVPTLTAGNPVKNALVDIAEHLQNVEELPANKEHAQTIKVPTTSKSNPGVAKLPRVASTENNTPISLLQEHSTDPKRICFRNSSTHQYNLRTHTRQPSIGTNFQAMAIKQLQAQDIFTLRVNHIYRPDGKKETIDSMLQGSDRKNWERSLSNKWGRLAQGNNDNVIATDTIDFVHQREVPLNRDITYAAFVLDYRPLKTNCIEYESR